MKLYLLSPEGVPMNQHLFPMFIDEWERQGVRVVDDIESADVVLFDLHSRIADYKEYDIDYILRNDLPIATFDEWDRGNMSKDVWPKPLTNQQANVMAHRMGRSVHFCRLLDKRLSLPKNIYPYEKPYFIDEGLLTPDELFNRPIDVTYIANTAPNREEIKKAFEADGRLKCNFILGAEKLPFDKWVDENRKSKFTISASGGGYSDEKKQNLFSICAIIQERTKQLLLHPLVHEIHCLKISQPPTKEDLDVIFNIVNDKERLYEIYKNGYEYMKKYYSSNYIASDILSKIKQHLT